MWQKTRFLVFGFGVLIAQVSTGQDLKEKYPFLNLHKNKIDFYGDSMHFHLFFKKLDQMLITGEGQINILHIGGSHVQGGTLERTMRKNLQSLAPELKAHRGLIFPYALAETNNPYYYVVKRRGKWVGHRISVSNHYSEWGVSGITATTYSPTSAVAIYARTSEDRFDFTKARIFYHQCKCSFEPVIKNKNQKKIKVDSSASFLEVTFSKPQDTLFLGLRRTEVSQSQFVLQGIQLLSDQPSIVYNTIGVNGAKTRDFLRVQNFQQQIKMIAPDLVIFGIGINDANTHKKKFKQQAYEKNYLELARIMRLANPDVAILFITNNDSYFQRTYPNPNIYKIRDGMINVSRVVNGAVYDFFQVMGGFDSIRYWQTYGLAAKDKIHLSKKGYTLQADLIFSALRKSYGAYLSALFQP